MTGRSRYGTITGSRQVDLLARYGAYVAGGSRATLSSSFSLSTAGANVCANTRRSHTLVQATSSLVLDYVNFWDNTGKENSGVNPITVRAAIEYPAGTFTPVLFAGARDVVIPIDGIVASDPVTVSIPKGAQFWTRTLVSTAANQQYPIMGPSVTADGDGVIIGTTYSDLTTSGTIAASNGYGYVPSGIRIPPASQNLLRVLGAGDSIMFGTGDSPETIMNGWWARAFDASTFNSRICYGSERALDFAQPWGRRRRTPLIRGANLAISNYGINDLSNSSSVARLKADLTTVWRILGAAGLPVFQTTITPHPTSTDNWTTVAGQTVAFFETNRTTINDWIRTIPAGLTGVIDVADVTETARNSGKWKTDEVTANYYTTDGTHPSAAAHAAIAAQVTSQMSAMLTAALAV